MSAYYYQSRKKSGGKKIEKGIVGVLLIVCSIVFFLAVIAPSWTGKFGAAIHVMLLQFSGWASVFIPIYLGWIGILQFSKEKESKIFRDSFLFFICFIFAACLFSLIFPNNFIKESVGAGGLVGDRVELFFVKQFGKFLVFVFCTAILFISGSLLLGLSPLVLLSSLKERIVQDISDWKIERKKMTEQNNLKKKIDQKTVLPKLESASATPPKILIPDSVTEKTKIYSSSESKSKSGMEENSKIATVKKPKNESVEVSKHSELSAGGDTLSGAGSRALSEKEEKPEIPLDFYQGYRLPDPDLLSFSEKNLQINKDELYENGTLLEKTLEQFGVKAKVVDIHPGPVITRYDLTPAPGVRVQQIETLANDISLAMKAQSIRVLAPVPGKAAVGIEIPNPHPAMVYLKEIILSPKFQNNSLLVPLGIGKTTEGESFISDLSAMPHFLIAGATGSGKSVCIHSLILSILFHFKPDEIKLFLIDPKRLELPVYDGIPHLYDPATPCSEVRVLTQPKEVVLSLKKLVDVMDDRYKNFAKFGVRNIESYNQKAEAQKIAKVSYIVVVIDELADLMIIVGKEIEDLIQRLAQMARAVGIHLVLATQRPSVDVITGVIKANLPSRVAFQVLSKMDSRVILDSQGAEDLLGKGDMLFLPSGAPKPVRLQGAFVSESEVNRVIQFIKEQGFKPQYQILQSSSSDDSIVDSEENLELLIRAARVVRDSEKVSGDLLRADKEIGSKYDLAMTLLKKRGLIEKPKDTNRWRIHFDRLAEFLFEVDKKA